MATDRGQMPTLKVCKDETLRVVLDPPWPPDVWPVGLLPGQWGFFLAMGAVPELRTEPIRVAFHLAAEFATAFSLLTGGIALLRAAV